MKGPEIETANQVQTGQTPTTDLFGHWLNRTSEVSTSQRKDSLPRGVFQAHALGFSLIPTNHEKKPLFVWKPYQKETPSADTLKRWACEYKPPAWAVVTGAISHVVVLDFDGPQGRRTLARLELQPHIKTGSGGFHLYLKHPGWPVQTLNSKSKIELGKRYPGLDIRADGGYAVFHGRNRSGQYELLRELIPDPLGVLPSDLRSYLGLDRPPQAKANGNGTRHIKSEGRVSTETIISRALDRVPSEGRNNAGFWLACQLRDNGYSQIEAERVTSAYVARVPPTNMKGQYEHYTELEAMTSLKEAYSSPPRDAWAVSENRAPTPPAPSEIEYGSKVQDEPSAAAKKEATTLPLINVASGDLTELTAKAWDAVKLANNPPSLFRQGALVRLETDDDGSPVTKELSQDRLRYFLARNADWVKPKKKDNGLVPVAPPVYVVRDLLATPDPPLPVLTRIVEAPVIAEDGTVQLTPGYNRANQTYYAPGPDFKVPSLPERISAIDVRNAAMFIQTEMLCDFPFTSTSELAGAVAIMLLPFVRDFIPGPTPLHLIEKPSPGTGATLLADILTFPALGRPLTSMAEGRDEDEWRKRLTSKLRTGSSAILIDNLRRRLDSSVLSSAITSIIWEDRILKTSDSVRIPIRCVWIATGNNPALSSEIARRTIRIRLDAKKDRPWLREGFKHPNLREWVKQNRSQLVWCLLTLGMAWVQEGKPIAKSPVTLGMFEKWAEVLGGILSVAGVDGFLSNLGEFYDQSDNEGEVWRSFVVAWWQKYKDRELGVADLHKLAIEQEVPLDLGEKGDRSQKTRLGLLLKQMRDRQFDSWRIVVCNPLHRAQQWKLIQVNV